MRVVALALVVALAGCSFLMKDKRLKQKPAPGQPPDCDTNLVIPGVDALLGVTGVAFGLGAAFGDGEAGERAASALVGVVGVAFLAGGWYGWRWHRECEAAKAEHRERAGAPNVVD